MYSIKICANCGMSVSSNELLCPYCGERLEYGGVYYDYRREIDKKALHFTG